MTNKGATGIEVYKDPSQPVEKRVQDLLGRMTLEEKIAQLGSCWVYQVMDGTSLSRCKADAIMSKGIGQITRLGGASSLEPQESAKLANEIQKYLLENTRLGIPAIIHEESCSGYMAKRATCFPQTIGVSCTWNPELAEGIGKVIREQMRAVGAHQALAPLMDVTRDPRWGRTEETFGEDPYLVSSMGVSYIKGLQADSLKEGVVATGKHFVGYGNSEGGMNWAPAHIPPRELREVFLAPFEAAVKEGKMASVMNGYHELDGIPCGCNGELLTDILRNEWGFDGIVVSDYFAVAQLFEYHGVAKDKTEAAKLALSAGLDVELPNTDCYGETLKQAVERGIVDESLVDRAVARVLKIKFLLGLFENPFVNVSKVGLVFDNASQRDLAYRVAQQSIVLLKNDSGILPLRKDIGSIAVIGPNADNARNMIGDYAYPCHIETLVETLEKKNVFGQPVPGNITLSENFVPIVSILQSIKDKVSPETRINYAKGCEVCDNSREGFKEAVEAAAKSDIAIVCVGDRAGLLPECTSGESRDMAELKLPGVQEELVKAVFETGTPVIVVLVNGRPYAINWIYENVHAVVEAWLPGEEGGRAVADVLFGDYNPGGKLTISFPRSSGQIPVYYYHKKSGGRSHWRGDYVDMSTKPLFPFGYGLSYTQFEYSNLRVTPMEVDIGCDVEVSLDVSNTGRCKGDEVVQLYIYNSNASVTRPVKELKGYKRVGLEAGETKTVKFVISTKQLGFYGRDNRFVVEPGTVNIMVGSSSEDIRLTGKIAVIGETTEIKESKEFFSKVEIK